MNPLVVVPHTETGLYWSVPAAVTREWPAAHFALTSARDPFAYATLLRRLWRIAEGLVICEQDVMPPRGAIANLLACPDPWCTHPHWMGDHWGFETTGLCKWSAELTADLPQLMDDVCAVPDPRYWVRRGWTAMPRDCNVGTLNGPGRKACLVAGRAPVEATGIAAQRPTTHDWHGIDADLATRLKSMGVTCHVHHGPTTHLHDWDANPPGSHLPWHQRPYDPIEWQ